MSLSSWQRSATGLPQVDTPTTAGRRYLPIPQSARHTLPRMGKGMDYFILPRPGVQGCQPCRPEPMSAPANVTRTTRRNQ